MTVPAVTVNYTSLQKVAQAFADQQESVQQLLRRVEDCQQTLRDERKWIGDNATVFYNDLDSETLPALLRLARAFAAAEEAVGQIASLFAAGEEEAASLFAGDTYSGGGTAAESPGAAPGGPTDVGAAFDAFRNNRGSYAGNTVVGYPRPGIARDVAQAFGFFRSDITELEAQAMDRLNTFQLMTLNNLHDEAFATEESVFGSHSNNDGLGDAFRHAYWSARMTQEFGAEWTQEFTDAHETKDGNPAARDFMDRQNNALGIRMAQQYPNASPEQLRNLIGQAIRSGQGVYIPGSAGLGANTPEQLAVLENGPVAPTDQAPDAANIPVDPNQIPQPGGGSGSGR
ncbi:MAG: WXG100 family type VII secretion target [Chloroflexi bacterium]|nr:WXG100 family type VII secretion target [Chloroflexota bacterium]